MSTTASLSLYSGDPLPDPTAYRSIMGALQYYTITRPYISFTVNKVCQFMHAPTTHHWLAVKWILRYLKGTLQHSFTFQASSDLSLMCYSDADWASSPDDKKSTSGYCVFFGPNLISWSSGKQRVVSRSSAESEYRGLANAAAELMWIEQLLSELQFTLPRSPTLFYDNISARDMAHNPVLHARTKHIEIDFHFVRERVITQAFNTRHLKTNLLTFWPSLCLHPDFKVLEPSWQFFTVLSACRGILRQISSISGAIILSTIY